MRLRASLLAGLILTSVPAWPAVTGRVLGADGRPLAGASVSAYARETEQQAGERYASGRSRVPLAGARTGADGAFRIDTNASVPWLEARADGYAPVVEFVTGDRPLSLTLTRVSARRRTVTAGGQAVVGAIVVWTSVGAETVTRSGPDGAFATPDTPEPSGLLVLHPDFAPQRADVTREAPGEIKLDAGVGVSGAVVDEAGRPVAGASVWLDDKLPQGVSDAQGTFRIAHAPQDWARLTARASGRVGVLPRAAGPLVVRLKPARSLSGTVRDAKSSQPLSGATVVASSEGGADSSVSADTNARGQYTFADLPAARYRVYAGRPGFESGPDDWNSGEPLDLRSVTSARRDFALKRRPSVAGRVVDEQGQPVDLAWMSFWFSASPYVYAGSSLAGFNIMTERSDAVYTAADGSFVLTLPPLDESGFPPSKDRPLVVLKPGYAAAGAEVPEAALDGRPLVITLPRGIELSGRVTSPEGVPVEGVALNLAEDGAFAGTMLPMHMVLDHVPAGDGWASTDAAGRFSTRVRARVHHVSLRKSGYAPRLVRDYDPRSGQPLNMVLEPAAVVRGRVARADGRGVGGVALSLSQPMNDAAGSVTTGDDGAFEIGDLAPGLYELEGSNAELGLSLKRTVEAPATDVQITLEPTGTLHGHVLDAASRQPVTRFELALEPGPDVHAGRRQVKVDDGGGGFSVADVVSGELSLQVSADGYAAKRVEGLSVDADADTPDVEVALEAETPIRGRVTSDVSVPVANAYVSAEGKERGTGSQSAKSDDDGQYELRGLAPGEVKLTWRASGFVPEKRLFDSRQGGRLDVVLKRGLVLRGDVLQDGAAVAKASVSARSSAADATTQSANSDERGRFVLEGLVPGHYTVEAQAEQGSATLEDVDVEHAGPLRLVLERTLTAVLTGKVVGLPPGQETTIAMVRAQPETGASTTAMVDNARSFRMEDAPTGVVRVSAIAMSMAGSMRSSRQVELTLAPGSETATVLEFPSDVVITGLVVQDGLPVPNAEVSFSSGDNSGNAARTDARGVYQIVGLDPGRYVVSVSADDVSFTTPHDVTGSGEFDIDITGTSLRGRVVRAEDGTALADVELALFRVGEEGSPHTTTTTNAQGAFSRRSLREGQYRLITSKPGFGQELRELELPRGETVEVLLALTPADGVSVTVVDARDGHALDAIVVVRDSAKRIVANRHSGLGENGVLNVPLGQGSYWLSTSASGFGTVTLPVTAPAQGLRVALTPGGTLQIEAPQVRGYVRLVRSDGEEYVRCWCNGIAAIEVKGRRTTVENITPGSYTLELLDAPEGVAPRPVVILEGQTSTVTLE